MVFVLTATDSYCHDEISPIMVDRGYLGQHQGPKLTDEEDDEEVDGKVAVVEVVVVLKLSKQ